MPLIMIGQNVFGREVEANSANDLEVNNKAERDTTILFIL